MHVIAPPAVDTFEDLQALQKRVSDAIIVSVDFESADHSYAIEPVMNKLSEAGCAYLDTRALHHGLPDSTPGELAKDIKVEHSLVKSLAWVTAETCPAKWHWKKPHVAQPYHCQLSRSVVVPSNTQIMDKLARRLDSFESMNLVPGKMARSGDKDGMEETDALADRLKSCSLQGQDALARDVFVLFWDSYLEE